MAAFTSIAFSQAVSDPYQAVISSLGTESESVNMYVSSGALDQPETINWLLAEMDAPERSLLEETLKSTYGAPNLAHDQTVTWKVPNPALERGYADIITVTLGAAKDGRHYAKLDRRILAPTLSAKTGKTAESAKTISQEDTLAQLAVLQANPAAYEPD